MLEIFDIAKKAHRLIAQGHSSNEILFYQPDDGNAGPAIYDVRAINSLFRDSGNDDIKNKVIQLIPKLNDVQQTALASGLTEQALLMIGCIEPKINKKLTILRTVSPSMNFTARLAETSNQALLPLKHNVHSYNNAPEGPATISFAEELNHRAKQSRMELNQRRFLNIVGGNAGEIRGEKPSKKLQPSLQIFPPSDTPRRG